MYAARSRQGGPILVFGLALALRLLYLGGSLPLLESRQTPIYGDASSYYLSAAALLDEEVDPSTISRLNHRKISRWDTNDAWSQMAKRGPA